jgi:hypothetical protein
MLETAADCWPHPQVGVKKKNSGGWASSKFLQFLEAWLESATLQIAARIRSKAQEIAARIHRLLHASACQSWLESATLQIAARIRMY